MTPGATPFDSDAPQGSRRPIIRYKPGEPGKKEMVNARWGSDPRFGDGVGYRFVRSEGRTFATHRCLVPVSDLRMRVDQKDFRVTRDDGNHFYLAGVWEPAMGEWPLSFRIITVAANADVSGYQDRHGAMIERRQVLDWLDATVSEDKILVAPAARTFVVERVGSSLAGQRALPV